MCFSCGLDVLALTSFFIGNARSIWFGSAFQASCVQITQCLLKMSFLCLDITRFFIGNARGIWFGSVFGSEAYKSHDAFLVCFSLCIGCFRTRKNALLVAGMAMVRLVSSNIVRASNKALSARMRWVSHRSCDENLKSQCK